MLIPVTHMLDELDLPCRYIGSIDIHFKSLMIDKADVVIISMVDKYVLRRGQVRCEGDERSTKLQDRCATLAQ